MMMRWTVLTIALLRRTNCQALPLITNATSPIPETESFPLPWKRAAIDQDIRYCEEWIPHGNGSISTPYSQFAMAADRLMIAVRTDNVYVNVYEYNNVTSGWVAVGDSIDPKFTSDADYYGAIYYDIVLSADGNVVAIGDSQYESDTDDDVGKIGRLVLFQIDSKDTWVQLGDEINFHGIVLFRNWGLALSETGTTFALGSELPNSNQAGLVRVYKYTEQGTWTQKGSDIVGEADRDRSGWSLAMSRDGSVLAVGAPFNDGNGSQSGHARVYAYVSNAWVQRGDDIDGEASEDYFSWALAMAADGNTIAIGADWNDDNGEDSGHTRVFKFDDDVEKWIQLGGDIDGEAADDWSAYSVDISADGSAVVIGAPNNAGGGTAGGKSGHLRIFDYNTIDQIWVQRGQDLDGEFEGDELGLDVSISGDGTVVGANGLNTKSLKIFEWSSCLTPSPTTPAPTTPAPTTPAPTTPAPTTPAPTTPAPTTPAPTTPAPTTPAPTTPPPTTPPPTTPPPTTPTPTTPAPSLSLKPSLSLEPSLTPTCAKKYSLTATILQNCIDQCFNRGHCCGNRLLHVSTKTSNQRLSCANGCEIAFYSSTVSECKRHCVAVDSDNIFQNAICEYKHPSIRSPFELCGEACTGVHTHGSDGWRIWANESMIVRSDKVWDVRYLKFYPNKDCTGTLIRDGAAISSGHFPNQDWIPENAFDDNMSLGWGGRGEGNPWRIFLGMTFSNPKSVQCVSFRDFTAGSGTTAVVVQKKNSAGQWINVKTMTALTPGVHYNIPLEDTCHPGGQDCDCGPAKSACADGCEEAGSFSDFYQYDCDDTSTVPSKAPSEQPSEQSSKAPSKQLSMAPSEQPSEQPSDQSSTTPSLAISAFPTLSPTSKLCPPYKEDRILPGCGDPTIGATLSPSSGNEVGGTVVQITNIKYCLDEDVNVYCRFENVVAGTRVDDSTIECISPPSNGASSTEVSYAVFIPGCYYDPAEAQWNVVTESFDYDGDLAGVVLIPTFGDNENARLIFAERQYNVKWNSDALLLSALASNVALSNLKIDLEVVAYVANALSQDLYFQVVQTLENITPMHSDARNIAVSDEAIAPAINSYVEGIKKVGFAVVRIVAYTKTSQGIRLVHATRTSKLIGVLPKNTDTTRNTCPVAPLAYCNQNSNDIVPPCPPTYSYAENDFDFYPDETCIHPTGGNECDITSDLDNEHLETCLENKDHPDFLKYCKGIDEDTEFLDNCDCNYFHFGAVGCIRNGLSQCCYSSSGGLLQDPNDGGGTMDCSSDFLKHFLYDILPYIYCCKLNNDCDTYYAARPSISGETYEKPQLPVYTFGDPHLESFDHTRFDFNGYGEFVVFCGVLNGDDIATNLESCKPSSEKVLARGDVTSVHFRFAQLDESHNGTVTVGVGIEDPSFRKGQRALTIVTHPTERLAVFDGGEFVIFPRVRNKTKRKKRKKISGALIFMTPVVTLPDFDVRVILKSGMMLRIRENNKGVMTVGFLRRPAGSGNYIGLLGTPDDNKMNDFTAANGTVLNMTSYQPLAKGYETIFHNFGKSWMVPTVSSSLFKALSASYDFNMFHFPNYLPSFKHFPADAGTFFVADTECNEEICGNFTGYLKESCCFDYDVTKDSELVRYIMIDAEKEDKIQTILNNTIPIIEGGVNQNITVQMGEKASFIIKTHDEDGDDLTATMDRSDSGLFNFFTDSPGVFRLSFGGTQFDGNWKAQVSIADGNSTILFTASVNVAPPPCVNDKFFRYQGDKKKSCAWVSSSETRRQKLCAANNDDVRLACRLTCGLCCKDSPTYKYTTTNGRPADCVWTAKKDSRSKKYCNREKVSFNCPITCNSCPVKFMCFDNEKFSFHKTKNKGSCAWIGKKEFRRLKYCGQPRVRSNCPTTCGLCCDDNQKYLFKTDFGKYRDCKWIAKQTTRKSKYCAQSQVSANCPAKTTCNSCRTYVDAN